MAQSITKSLLRLPEGAWDSHIHIIDEDYWPISNDAPFHPKQATLVQLLEFEQTIGIDHVCIIAMSVYGFNNDCSIDALRRLRGKGRGIACIDPDTITDAELDELHGVGFRGVRLNLRTRSQTLSQEEWAKSLRKYANRIRRLDWVIQIFVSMPQIAFIAPIIPSLGVKIVFDHLGHPEGGTAPVRQQGCKELYALLDKNKNVYVKLSGTYRLEKVPDLEDHIRYILGNFPDQVIWASDWPHTAGPEKNPGGDPKALQDNLHPDIPAFVRDSIAWCNEDEVLMRKIWVDNPRKLWDYSGTD